MTDASVTAALRAWRGGDARAQDELMQLVYPELHRRAERLLARERPGHTLQPTALISELYLRLVDQRQAQWQDRAHFFAMSARLMRHILVNVALSKDCRKRGGGATQVSFDEALVVSHDRGDDLVALDDALTAFASVDARKAQVVELRFFGGLSVEESAEALKVSPETVRRDWKLAKVWLHRELTKDGAHP